MSLREQVRDRCQPVADAFVVFGCFRVSNLASLVRTWLPNSRFILGITRIVRSSTARLPDLQEFSRSESSSHALRRHLSVFSSREPPFYRGPMPTMDPFQKTPHKAFQPFSISGPRGAFFIFHKMSRELCLFPWRIHLLGLATHLMAFAPTILGGFFQPPTLLGFTLQSLIPNRQSKPVSRLSSALTLFCKTFRPHTGAPAIYSCRLSSFPCHPVF